MCRRGKNIDRHGEDIVTEENADGFEIWERILVYDNM